MQMKTGIQTDVLDLLQIKMVLPEQNCVLILDEVQLKRKIEYDVSLKSITGYVDPELGNSTEEASHALVYMIKGLQVPYKQVVA